MSTIKLTLEEFCRIARKVIEDLPVQFGPWLENVVVDVETSPSPRDRRAVGVPRGQTVLGLFHGTAVTEQTYGERLPNRIVLYKHPIESVCRSQAEVAYEIRRTVVHELAHHFGYSEEDLQEFESNPSPFQPRRKDKKGPRRRP